MGLELYEVIGASLHTWGESDIVEGEVCNSWVQLEEEGQWLSDAT